MTPTGLVYRLDADTQSAGGVALMFLNTTQPHLEQSGKWVLALHPGQDARRLLRKGINSPPENAFASVYFNRGEPPPLLGTVVFGTKRAFAEAGLLPQE